MTRNIKVAIVLMFVIFLNLPTFITSRDVYPQMVKLVSEYENSIVVQNEFIESEFLNLFEYVRLINYTYDTFQDVSIIKNYGMTNDNIIQYGKKVKVAGDWSEAVLVRDRFLNTVKRGMSTVGVSNDSSFNTFDLLFKLPGFKYIVIAKGICYEIRFKAKLLYVVLVFTSMVLLCVLIYSELFTQANPSSKFLYEEEDLYFDDENTE